MMSATGQAAMIEQYYMQPFTVKVLSKERTFCEKIMSLVRFSQTENPYVNLSNKVRHVYDIHMILKDAVAKDFLQPNAFDELLLRVGNDDAISFKNNNK